MPKGKISKEEFELKMSAKKWKNRRWMAWISLISILIVTYYMIVVIDENRIEVLQPVITWFYTVMGSIVAAYHGFATFEDIKFKELE
jgi:hypothetical protein